VGTILSCDQAGVRLSLGFFDEIYVPKELLIEDTSWSSEEELWVWNATDTDQLFFDLDNTARFRVAQVPLHSHTQIPSARRKPKCNPMTSRCPSGEMRPHRRQRPRRSDWSRRCRSQLRWTRRDLGC